MFLVFIIEVHTNKIIFKVFHYLGFSGNKQYSLFKHCLGFKFEELQDCERSNLIKIHLMYTM